MDAPPGARTKRTSDWEARSSNETREMASEGRPTDLAMAASRSKVAWSTTADGLPV